MIEFCKSSTSRSQRFKNLKTLLCRTVYLPVETATPRCYNAPAYNFNTFATSFGVDDPDLLSDMDILATQHTHWRSYFTSLVTYKPSPTCTYVHRTRKSLSLPLLHQMSRDKAIIKNGSTSPTERIFLLVNSFPVTYPVS